MEIIKIVGVGIAGSLLAVLLKSQKPELAFLITAATCISIFLMVKNALFGAVYTLAKLFDNTYIDFEIFNVVLKVLGVSYIASFASEMCKDAGQNSVAQRIEFAGKTVIFVMSVPLMVSLLNMVISLV